MVNLLALCINPDVTGDLNKVQVLRVTVNNWLQE